MLFHELQVFWNTELFCGFLFSLEALTIYFRGTNASAQPVEKQAATAAVPEQAEVLPLVLTALKATVLGVQAAVLHLQATAVMAMVGAAAAVQALKKPAAAAVTCHGDCLTLCTARQMRSRLRKKGNFEIPTK